MNARPTGAAPKTASTTASESCASRRAACVSRNSLALSTAVAARRARSCATLRSLSSYRRPLSADTNVIAPSARPRATRGTHIDEALVLGQALLRLVELGRPDRRRGQVGQQRRGILLGLRELPRLPVVEGERPYDPVGVAQPRDEHRTGAGLG